MANILFTWEIGAHLGHLGKLRALMPLARQQGHTLSAALKSLNLADQVLGELQYRCFQAPYRQAATPRPTPRSLSWAHTLEDFCFADAGELFLRIKAWREIFDAVQPDIIYCEYSPGALIASRGLGIARVAVGNGFANPPGKPVSGVWAPFATTSRDPATLATLAANDARMLSVLNQGCERAGVPAFDCLGEIFSQADRHYLATLPELDHFQGRVGGQYLGIQPAFGKAAPRWPVAGGKRVYCYLQDFPGRANLLKALTDAGLAVLLFTHEPPALLKQQFAKVPNIRFTSEAVDLRSLQEEAHFVVHHAGHGTAVLCFLYGLPQLSVPIQQEQLLAALQLDRCGVGVTALYNQGSFANEIKALVGDDSYRMRARQFRDRYADYSWSDAESTVLSDMSRLLQSP